jgi:RNA polymerase-binding transcription factor DksA
MTTTRRTAEAPAPLDLADQLPELHAALKEQRQFRLEQLRDLAEGARSSTAALDEVHDQVGEILRTSATTALTEVEAALDRLQTGTYGRCERCTTHIPYERLEILPMSRYCMRCQHDLEMGSG